MAPFRPDPARLGSAPNRESPARQSRYRRPRRDGRAVEGNGLENRRTCKGAVGSNPTLSAMVEWFDGSRKARSALEAVQEQVDALDRGVERRLDLRSVGELIGEIASTVVT